MTRKMFCKLEGVAGEAKDPRHFGEIEITSWAFGGAQSPQAFALGARAEGDPAKSLLGDLTVTKATDRTSAILVDACIVQKKFKKAVISMETVSERGQLLRALILKLNAVTISSMSSTGETDHIAFAYEAAEIQYPRAAR